MLINCVAYQDGKRLAEIQPQEIHRYLAMPGCFVWVASGRRSTNTTIRCSPSCTSSGAGTACENVQALYTQKQELVTIRHAVAVDIYLFYRLRKAQWL